MKKANKNRMTKDQQKAIIEAHNRMENGIKLGVQKSQKTGYYNTPLFRSDNQTSLF